MSELMHKQKETSKTQASSVSNMALPHGFVYNALCHVPRRHFGGAWGALGRLLGVTWPALGRSWAGLGPSLALLGRLLGVSWALLGVSWLVRNAFGMHWAPRTSILEGLGTCRAGFGRASGTCFGMRLTAPCRTTYQNVFFLQ